MSNEVSASLTAEYDLTPGERLFIAERLMSRARHQTKKLRQAEGRTVHPQLILEIRGDVVECTRLALKLQGLAQ